MPNYAVAPTGNSTTTSVPTRGRFDIVADARQSFFESPPDLPLSSTIRTRDMACSNGPSHGYSLPVQRPAAVMAYGLELMGAKDVRNYYKSWSEWVNADDTPVVKPEPKK